MLTLLAASLATAATTVMPVTSCPKYGFLGYSFQKRTGLREDQYYSPSTRVTLTVKCFPKGMAAEPLVAKLKNESSVRNTAGDAVYFEFKDRGRFRRVYVVTHEPVFQLTFETRNRNRSALDGTQELVEKHFPKSWDVSAPKSP